MREEGIAFGVEEVEDLKEFFDSLPEGTIVRISIGRYGGIEDPDADEVSAYLDHHDDWDENEWRVER